MIKQELFVFNFVAMTTPCEVQIYESDSVKAFNCFEAIKVFTFELEKKYNFYDRNSFLNKTINNRKRNKVSLDKLTYDILEKVKNLSTQTNGLFDISIGTIKKCYDLDSLEKFQESKAKLINKMGNESWHLKDGNIHFKFKETKLDLGGVIKEVSVDFAARIAKDHGVTSALINFGGDIFALGTKPDGKPFSIGIKNPKNPEQNLLLVNISNQALTTSASYERNKNIENKNFSHIISKNSFEEEILSSTVISNTTLKSGVFSTSLMIDSACPFDNEIKVVLIDKDLNLHQNLVN